MKKIIVSLFFSTLFAYAQTTELTGWQINDVKLSSKFLQAYLDTLENYENLFSDNDPQLDDILIIRIEIGRDEDIKLSDIKSKSIGSRTYSRMIDTLIQKLDKKLIDELISRRYSWTELNKDELLQIGIRQDVKNIFQERSAKTTRDAFWWTNREFDLSSNLRFVIRPYKSTWGFIVEQGLSNIGYDVLSSRSISMGVVNEITKVSLIAPWKLPYESALLMGRPLDGFDLTSDLKLNILGVKYFFKILVWVMILLNLMIKKKNNFITVLFLEIYITATHSHYKKEINISNLEIGLVPQKNNYFPQEILA